MNRQQRLGGLVLLCITMVAACGTREPTSRVTLDAAAAALLPADDGAPVVAFVGSEIFGSLDGCGCLGNPQLGGIPYRMAVAEGLRAARPDVATLQLDAGRSMAAITNPEGKVIPDFEMQDEWVLTALDRLGFDAVNLTDQEAPFMARYLRADAYERAVAERPVIGRFVSANVEPARPDLVAPSPYVVRTLDAPRAPGGRVRIAVVGVTQLSSSLEAQSGFRVTDPAAALARVLPRARQESDAVIVLAYMPAVQGEALAKTLGESADVVIVANSISGDRQPSLDGPYRVAYSWYKTQKLGVLGLHLDGGAVRRATWSFVQLDTPLPRDPLADEIVADAKAAVKRVREARQAAANP